MIECIFTIDCEIYGNGEGSLKSLVYEPAEKLISLFRKMKKRFVAFIELAELEMIEEKGTDPAIDLAKKQIRDLHGDGFELGLHLHPQWYQARYHNGNWLPDYSEYNLCILPRERIIQIVDRAIGYLRKVLGSPEFTPLSFRAGNWLFQPTQPAATVLAEKGIMVDSSVFKGGLQHLHGLDYRPALGNGYYWRFQENVNVPDAIGSLIEMPIYTQMVPFWRMITGKRVGLQQKAAPSTKQSKDRMNRVLDFLRFHHPLKLDFCRMTKNELTGMMDGIMKEDQGNPASFRPVVAIGHTKDLIDLGTVEYFLSYLDRNGIKVSTFETVYPKCTG